MERPRQNMSLLPCKKILTPLVCTATVSGCLLYPADFDQGISQGSHAVSHLGQLGVNAKIFGEENLLVDEEGSISGASVIPALDWNVIRGNEVFAGFEIPPEPQKLREESKNARIPNDVQILASIPTRGQVDTF